MGKKLILLRHGESDWNKKNFFTGWVDIPLSTKGIEESLAAGDKIAHHPIDVIFVSSLMRSQVTACLAMSRHKGGRVPCFMHEGEGKLGEWAEIHGADAKHSIIPVYKAWQLNERMYGKLQGLNKKETMEKFGDAQVKLWRRSFDVAPPEGESLEMTAKRTLPYFKKHIVAELDKGKNVFVSAHGNSLRSIIMELDGLSEKEVVELELPTGVPVIYTYTGGKWKKESV